MASILNAESSSEPSNGPQVSPEAGPSNTKTHGNVIQRRIFIGPMPERVISQTENQPRKNKLTLGSVFSLSLDATDKDKDKIHHSNTGDKSEEVTRLLKENAYRFFLHEGGNSEDWGEEEEQDVTDELVKRWKESEWGQLWTRRHHRRNSKNEPQNAVSNQWFGTSFEVGKLMGVDVLQGQEHVNAMSKRSVTGGNTGVAEGEAIVKTPGQETFLTSRSEFASSTAAQINIDVTMAPASDDNQELPTPASSRTGLLTSHNGDAEEDTASDRYTYFEQHKAKSETFLRPVLAKNTFKRSAQTDTQVKANVKGKAKVHYADVPESPAATTPGPAPPEEVLERTTSTVDVNTSLAASFIPEPRDKSPTPSELLWGDIVLRDRMLVRVDYTKSEGITKFDEAINRTTRDLSYEDWGEFLVAWRKDSIEIYRDHTTPGKDWVTGHKHLLYVIPLRSSRTRLSLYSFVDLSFSITCAPTTTRLNANSSRWIFSREKEGTNIFVFKLKSRSRAYDWTWQLWRQMGGQIPRSIDIFNPRLSTKVTIDIPESDEMNSDSLYRLFRRDNIIELCMESLRKVPDWKFLIEKEINDGHGRSLQLAWRSKANLDWVWLDDDVFGKARAWSVLCGLAFKQALRPPSLEIRVAEHIPSYIHLKDGRRMEEPPAIEGYLDRIRPNTQMKQQTYLVTHLGYLFTLNSHMPFPPMPPGLAPALNFYNDAQVLRHAEVRRGMNQIMTATGVMDLRSIVAVRRAFQLAPLSMHTEKEVHDDDDGAWFNIWSSTEERTPEDEADEGGESGLAKATDRPKVRMRRSFELLLTSGHVVRFETYSTQVAIEWIDRLRALSFYWKRRHRTDAKQEIELAQAQRPRLTPQTRLCHDDHEVPPEEVADLSTPYAAIDTLHNWCILEGCKSIVKCGRIYMRKGLRGQYKLVQLLLVAGHLVRFRIGSNSSLYPSMRKKISLVDAYVCSGFFAAQALPKGQYKPNAPTAPRRYQDGLETDDREEDMLFMLWYRPYPQMASADQDPTTTPVSAKAVPTLSAKHKVLLFRTRSVLERDAWCWALNSEIEKIVRAQKDREGKLSAGNLVKLEGQSRGSSVGTL